jgi:hypothetical protein
LRLYRRANPDGNPRQLTSEAPGTPYGLAHATPYSLEMRLIHRAVAKIVANIGNVYFQAVPDSSCCPPRSTGQR